MTSEACVWGGAVRARPGRRGRGGVRGRGREDLAEASGPGAGSGPLPGGVSCPVHPPRLSPPPPRAAPCMVSAPLSPRPLPPSLFPRPSPPGWRRLGTGTQSLRTRLRGGHPRRGAHAPARGEARGAAPRPPTGSGGRGRRGEPGRRGRPLPGSALRNPATHPPQHGLAMAAPRPPRAISVSAPVFYAPQKKFGPVVAPKPKVNPFRPGDSEPPSAAGAQRAQMGRVGEIPPPPPEGMWPSLGAGPRRAPAWGEWFWEFGDVWRGRSGGGWAQPPSPEQMFLPHRGAHGWGPGLLGPFQVPRLGVGGGNVGHESSPLGPFSEV